ncbi:MAG: metal-sensitive transcriptional regulator [Candidatus Gastranaerophilales bacterium]|nr:metal-sensitive transcriptional regulator [Candidatus Gastranaerophilales bacterium]
MKKCNCRSQEDNKDLIVRLNRIEGQIEAVKNLLQNEEKCVCMDLMNQIKSATCAMRGVWEVVAARHLEGCVTKMEATERNKVIEYIISCLKELR